MIFSKKKIIIFIICALFATENVFSSERALISKIRFSGNNEALRVIIDSNNLIKHEISAFTNPSRIVVDLYNVKFSKDFSFPQATGVIKGIRYAT